MTVKYYVTTGDFQVVIEGQKDPKEAALEAFDGLAESKAGSLGSVTLVSRHGFDSESPDDIWIPTMDLLEQTGMIANFKRKDGF